MHILDLITRWIIALTWSSGLGGLAYSTTAQWPDWAGGITTGLAFLFALWMFSKVFWLGTYEDDGSPVEPIA